MVSRLAAHLEHLVVEQELMRSGRTPVRCGSVPETRPRTDSVRSPSISSDQPQVLDVVLVELNDAPPSIVAGSDRRNVHERSPVTSIPPLWMERMARKVLPLAQSSRNCCQLCGLMSAAAPRRSSSPPRPR